MRVAYFAFTTVLVLSGCEAAGVATDQIVRQQAKVAINAAVAQRFPGVNAEPITNCVVDNATTQEIVTIAGAAAAGTPETSSRTIIEIVQRPATLQCITNTGLGNLAV
ncbi:succinate dehydrogenase [Aliiroseovarius sp. 2305UL8-7]|uniref:succinate dehydrogenase n=1 Tax=Aliiroseovarius conchicola TaxID=3121637 RepID=UPI0035293EE2